MATFQDFEDEWKTNIANFAQEQFEDLKDALMTNANSFFADAKDDLQNWTKLLADKQIDKDEFKELVDSNKVLLNMNALKQAGLAEARMDAFVNGIIDKTVSTAIKLFI